jgi:hypothetical protein
MPAHGWNRCDRVLAIDEIHVNHRMPAVCLAFRARIHASLAPNATRRIDEEAVIYSDLRILHADTLNSGILLRGSSDR